MKFLKKLYLLVLHSSYRQDQKVAGKISNRSVSLLLEA